MQKVEGSSPFTRSIFPSRGARQRTEAMCSVVCLSSRKGRFFSRRRSQVVRQRSAKPPSPVRLRSPPPASSCICGVRFRYILSTVAPVGALHPGTRLRYLCYTLRTLLSAGASPLSIDDLRRSAIEGGQQVVLIELGVVEQRHEAVLEVLGGLPRHRGRPPLRGHAPDGAPLAAPLRGSRHRRPRRRLLAAGELPPPDAAARSRRASSSCASSTPAGGRARSPTTWPARARSRCPAAPRSTAASCATA